MDTLEVFGVIRSHIIRRSDLFPPNKIFQPQIVFDEYKDQLDLHGGQRGTWNILHIISKWIKTLDHAEGKAATIHIEFAGLQTDLKGIVYYVYWDWQEYSIIIDGFTSEREMRPSVFYAISDWLGSVITDESMEDERVKIVIQVL